MKTTVGCLHIETECDDHCINNGKVCKNFYITLTQRKKNNKVTFEE